MDLQALHANYQATQLPSYAPQQSKKTGGLRGALLNFLPTITSAAGTVIGGAAGSVIPGAGTAAGAIGGGALGGGLGEFLRAKLSGDDLSVGNVARETGFGALGGVGKGIQIARGAKAADASLSAGRALITNPAKAGIKGAIEGTEAAVAPTARNIKVNYVPSETTGVGTSRVSKNTLTNPTVGGLTDAITGMENQGYKVSQKLGTTPGSSLPGNVGVAPDFTPLAQSQRLPAVSLTGNKTAVKFGETAQGVPKSIGTNVADTRAAVIANGKKVAGIEAPKSTAKAPQTTEAAMQARKGITQKVGEKLSAEGSGLKVGPNVGDINDLSKQSQVMTKYTGTPKTQLKKIDADMSRLSGEVDGILATTPVKLDGRMVGERLKKAATDLTDERFIDLDLNNESVQKIIGRYSEKFAQAQDAKGVNDIVKTLNKVATKASTKLQNSNASPLTAQESASLALKRAGDDVLSEIPEIAPLKQQMAQLFDVNPQVAKASEQGFSLPFVGGSKVKGPMQAIKGIQSYAGSALQGGGQASAAAATPTSFRPFLGQTAKAAIPQAGARAAGSVVFGTPFVGSSAPEGQSPVGAIPELPTDSPIDQAPAQSRSIFGDPAKVEEAYAKALMAGDTQTAASILKGYEMFGKQSGEKPLSAEASKTVSNAQTGIQALNDFNGLVDQNPDAFSRTNLPGVGVLDKITSGRASGALGTSSLNAARQQVIDVIARLRTGAAISNDEAARFEQYVPQPGDSPEARAQKTSYLMNQFQFVAQRSGGAGNDTQAALGVQ